MILKLRGEAPQAPGHSTDRAEELAYRGTGPRAHTAFGHRSWTGRLTGDIPHRRIGTPVRLAGPQVEDDSARHDGHAASRGLETAALLLEPARYAVRRRQPVGGTPGQEQRIHTGHQMMRRE